MVLWWSGTLRTTPGSWQASPAGVLAVERGESSEGCAGGVVVSDLIITVTVPGSTPGYQSFYTGYQTTWRTTKQSMETWSGPVAS